jgi:signal recognition particle receptor subunit beta
MIKKTGTTGLPYVVVANKADLRGAMPDSAIRSAMELSSDIPIIRSHAKDLTKVQPGLPCELKQEDIEKALDVVFSRIMKGGN